MPPKNRTNAHGLGSSTATLEFSDNSSYWQSPSDPQPSAGSKAEGFPSCRLHPCAGAYMVVLHPDTDTLRKDLDITCEFLRQYTDTPNTFKAYLRETERFLLWSHGHMQKNLSELTKDDLYEFRDFLGAPPSQWTSPRTQRQLKDGTLNAKWRPFNGPLYPTSIDRALVVNTTAFGFFHASGYLAKNPFKIGRPIKSCAVRDQGIPIEKYLTTDEWDVFLEMIENADEEPKSVAAHERLRFLIYLLYYATPRISEVANATMGDFTPTKDGWMLRLVGKGNKAGMVPVHPRLLEALKSYRQHLGLSPLPSFGEEGVPLIENHLRDGPLHLRRLHGIIQEAAESLIQRIDQEDHPGLHYKLHKLSPHWFRHTGLTHLAEAGVNLQYVQAHARHSHIETTAKHYLHLDQAKRHSELLKLK